MATTSMDDILSGRDAKPEPAQAELPVTAETPQPRAEVKPEAEPVKQEEPVKEQPRGPDGKFLPVQEAETKKAEVPKEAPKPQQQGFTTEREKALYHSVMEERRKRQELERHIAAQQQVRQPVQPQQPAEPAKTFWDDPEANLNAIRAEVDQKVQQAVINTRVLTAEALARQRHADYDIQLEVFKQIAGTMPGMYQQVLAAADPAEAAYTIAKNHTEMKQIGDIEAYKLKVRQETEAELRTKLEAEYKAKVEEDQRQREALAGTASLSNVPATPQQRVQWGGPTPLSDIINKR